MTIDVLTLVMLTLLVVIVLAGVGVGWRNALWNRDIKTKYAVTLKGREGSFAGLLVQESWRTMTFENCMTVPEKPTDTPQPILGRVHVDRANIAYRQELPYEEPRRIVE